MAYRELSTAGELDDRLAATRFDLRESRDHLAGGARRRRPRLDVARASRAATRPPGGRCRDPLGCAHRDVGLAPDLPGIDVVSYAEILRVPHLAIRRPFRER